MTTEAQQLLNAAFAGDLNLDADASQGQGASAPNPAPAPEAQAPAAPAAPAAAPADGAAPAAAPTAAAPAAASPAPAAAAPSSSEEKPAPIASKSGDYTIPYEKLVAAREERDRARAEAAQLRDQVAQLNAAQAANLGRAQGAAQARADAGQAPTQADKNAAVAAAAVGQGADAALFGDFSEEGIAKGIRALTDQARDQVRAELREELSKHVAPLQESAAKSAAQTHREAIYGAHPDADEVYESAEFRDWLAGKPAFLRGAIENTLKSGAATDVVDVFSAFKSEAKPAAAPAPAAPAAAASPAVAQAKAAAQAQPIVPNSLSDLTGDGTTGSEGERLNKLAEDPKSLLTHMQALTPAQIERAMNSV
ncbi:Meckel syndrome type 1 protein [Pseudacidovorax sp. 1753]|uniref:hypothetical protein n=1 Tax=Pseudacidovorax sp. 1753 TaxID=3156419 RepID=UPI003391CC48